MAKKIKREKGFYRQLKNDLRAMGERKIKPMKYFEFWLKHRNDSSKDIHFYYENLDEESFLKSRELLRPRNDDDYEDHFLVRVHDVARTRKEKAVLKSRLHGIPNVKEL